VSLEFTPLLSGLLGLVIVCASYYSTTSCKEGFSEQKHAQHQEQTPSGPTRESFSSYEREKRDYQRSLDKQVQRIAEQQTKILNPATFRTYMKSEFEDGDRKNPLSNVLLTQIQDNPDRKAAPPSFNPQVHEVINEKTKRLVQTLNPSIQSTNKQLFGSLSDNFDFEQSQRQFYSTASTRVDNNQGAFADWLYGGAISSKEAHPQSLMQNNPRHNLY
jgi:hypothetical protein